MLAALRYTWPAPNQPTAAIATAEDLGEVRLARLPQAMRLESAPQVASEAQPLELAAAPEMAIAPASPNWRLAPPEAPRLEPEPRPSQPEPPEESLVGAARFMGASASGVRFCIVADRSGSMRGRKLDYVKQEVIRTVAAMQPTMRFHVILFGSEPIAFEPGRWSDPERDLAELERWLSRVTATGETRPTSAMGQAFSLFPQPDAVFFLTDGDFPDEVVRHVASVNRFRTPIHTIAFLERQGEGKLKRVANSSGGEYRFLADF